MVSSESSHEFTVPVKITFPDGEVVEAWFTEQEVKRLLEKGQEEKMYTAADVAKEANITKMSVINAIKAKQLKATKIGVQWLIAESDKNEYLANRRKPGRPKTK